jgi:hypothetical protein
MATSLEVRPLARRSTSEKQRASASGLRQARTLAPIQKSDLRGFGVKRRYRLDRNVASSTWWEIATVSASTGVS